jgi:hypothetical protein
MESERLRCYRQTPKWYWNEQRLFCDKPTYSIWISNLSPRKGTALEMTCSSSRQLLSSHKSGFNRLFQRTQHAPHAIATHPIWLIWPQWLLLVSYSERKFRTDSGGWGAPIFELPQDVLGGSHQKELKGRFQAWMWPVENDLLISWVSTLYLPHLMNYWNFDIFTLQFRARCSSPCLFPFSSLPLFLVLQFLISLLSCYAISRFSSILFFFLLSLLIHFFLLSLSVFFVIFLSTCLHRVRNKIT